MGRKLSMSREAVRQRKHRAQKKRDAKLAGWARGEGADASEWNDDQPSDTPSDVTDELPTGPVPAPASNARIPVHSTTVIESDDPMRYAAPLLLPAGEAVEGADATPEEPFVPPAAGPEQAGPLPPSSEEVAGIAFAIASYFEAGAVTFLRNNAADMAARNMDPKGLAEMLPRAKEFVRQSAERVCIKYGIRIPFQDEIVVAGAVGFATFSLFGPKKPQTAEQQADQPERARNANPNPAGNPNANGVQRPPIVDGPPAPPMGGESVADNT